MPLDVPTPFDVSTAIIAGFGELGIHAPKPRSNMDTIAWEYWASSLLLRLAEGRRERAKKAAVAGGVLPDHTAKPLPVGTVETVYASELITISVKVVEQADRLNAAGLIADLEKAGIAKRTLTRLVKKHTTTFPGAHVFTASIA